MHRLENKIHRKDALLKRWVWGDGGVTISQSNNGIKFPSAVLSILSGARAERQLKARKPLANDSQLSQRGRGIICTF